MPHAYYMEKALECAFSRIGITSPNPPVGALIVSGDTIISSGGTQAFGYDHAEICALKNAPSIPSDSRMYVTLEPCCHYGKTPPCTEAIINSGIREVYIGAIDPNPLVSGKGIARLREQGINVTVMDEFCGAASDLIRPFRTLLEKKRPHVLHKAAMTLDGCTASRRGDSKWISSEDSRSLVHRFRSVVDAVIIGKGTYLSDDPSLNVRSAEIREDVSFGGYRSWILDQLVISDFSVRKTNPLRVLAGLPDSFRNRNLFYDDRYIIYTAEDPGEEDLPDYIDRDKIVFLKSSDSLNMVEDMLQSLKEMGIMLCMLEGGARLASSFYKTESIDEVLYFYSPRIIGGGHPLFSEPHHSRISDGTILQDVSTLSIGGDTCIHGYTGGVTCLPE